MSFVSNVIGNALSKADISKTLMDLEAVDSAITTYHLEYGVYPSGTASDILDSLEGQNPQAIRFIQWPDREDAWGNVYLLKPRTASSRPVFYSSGQDMVDDKCAAGSDDVEFIRP